MEREIIEKLVEAILFVSGEPINMVDITSKLEITEEELNAAVETLRVKYNKDTSGIVLLEFNHKLQLATNSDLVEDIMKVICPIRERALTKSAIETLSIIAYKQPITRLEIEEIRGVSCDYAINILLDHKLIEVVGKKDAVGKPLLFGTTDEFLKRFNLSSLEMLPDKNQLMDRIATLKSTTDTTLDGTGLYRNFDISSEAIIPEKVLENLNKMKTEAEAADADDFV